MSSAPGRETMARACSGNLLRQLARSCIYSPPAFSFPRFPQIPDGQVGEEGGGGGVSKRIVMPLLIRFRLAKDLSTLSRVGAKVQLWGSLVETSWQRPFALEAFKVCTCTFTRHSRLTDANLDASA